MNIPDPERAARIQLLKEQVRKGTYKIDADKVAQSMLKDLINQDNIFSSSRRLRFS